jgi:transcriptional regulator with XRE-family HTH domain
MAGSPAHVPTAKSRGEVTALTSFGNTQEEIASYLGISVDTLTKYYRQEIDTALIRANAEVANRLYRKATKGDDLKAQIFWLKTRAKWRERDKEEEKDDDKSILEKIITGEIVIRPA